MADAVILQIAGLPLHPLLVHATVVLIPLTVLALWLGTVWPAARRRLGMVTPIAALGLLVLVPLTVAAGLSLAEVVGPLPAVERHRSFGLALLPWVIALFFVAAGQWAWFRFGDPGASARSATRARWIRVSIGALAFVVGSGTLVLTVFVGDSGARAVWGGLLG